MLYLDLSNLGLVDSAAAVHHVMSMLSTSLERLDPSPMQRPMFR